MSRQDDLVAAFLILARSAEQKDHYKTQPREEGQFAPHGGGSGGAHKKPKAGGKPKAEKPKKAGVFDEEEGGYFRQMPDGGVEWVPAGREEPGEEPGEKPKPGQTIKMFDGRERPATIVEHGSARIVTPDDMDTSAQSLNAEDVKSFIDQVPAEHRGVFSEVRILDEPYQDQGGINDRAAATYYPETGVIELHKNSQFPASELRTILAQTVRHEGAHALTDKLPKSFVTEWKQAARKDGGAISDYAQTNTHEDIAETIARHWSPDPTERRVVQRFFPERYALLQKYGIKPGG